MKKIGIINSGGDCAGLNAVISSIVKTGSNLGYEFVGFYRGWEGLLDPLDYTALTRESVRGISHLGGTILRTTNRGRFAGKIGAGDVYRIDPEILGMAKKNAEALGLEGLIVIGGDGTLSAAVQLSDYGLKIIGVPKTIDNDLGATDKTFGFSTAVQVAVDALDKIHTTATAHDRVFLVECMGRHAGWISLFAGLAGSANAVLLPEFGLNVDDFISFLKTRRSAGRGSAVVVVAEGINISNRLGEDKRRASEHSLAGASQLLMEEIEARAPDEFELRNVILGHTQRGGSPNAQDRILAKRYGVEAMLAYDRGEESVMVAIRSGQAMTVPIGEAVHSLKLVTKDTPEYVLSEKLGMFVN